jgi:hypothetical protein
MSLIAQVTQPRSKSYPRTPRQPDKWITGNCVLCGKEFTRPLAWTVRRTKYKAGQFCSRACARKGQSHPPRTMIPAACITCGKDFQYKKGLSGAHLYCSRTCAWIGNGKRERGPLHRNWKGGESRSFHVQKAVNEAKKAKNKCEHCGSAENLHGHHKAHYSKAVELRADPSNIEVLCSVCHAKEHPELANLIQIPHKRSGIMVPCRWCGVPYYVKKSKIGKTKYCSKPCADNGWKGRSKSRPEASDRRRVTGIPVCDQAEEGGTPSISAPRTSRGICVTIARTARPV